jgi:predicted XRE-type DNA-binding protein
MSDCIDHGRKGNRQGYSNKRAVVDGVYRSIGVHRLAFIAANGYLPDTAMHTCDNPRCINAEHLVAGTNILNIKDRSEKGRTARQTGESNGFSKYSDDFVLMIYNAYKNGTGNQYEIADIYGISQPHVSAIVTGRFRSDITGAVQCAKSRAKAAGCE